MPKLSSVRKQISWKLTLRTSKDSCNFWLLFNLNLNSVSSNWTRQGCTYLHEQYIGMYSGQSLHDFVHRFARFRPWCPEVDHWHFLEGADLGSTLRINTRKLSWANIYEIAIWVAYLQWVIVIRRCRYRTITGVSWADSHGPPFATRFKKKQILVESWLSTIIYFADTLSWQAERMLMGNLM